MSARPGKSFLALFLEALAEADDALKRELATYLRPYLADGPDRLLDATEKARQLGLHPETLVKMARAGRCIGAIKVGQAWRFPPDSLEILPPHPQALPAPRRRRRHYAGRRRRFPARLWRFAAVPSVPLRLTHPLGVGVPLRLTHPLGVGVPAVQTQGSTGAVGAVRPPGRGSAKGPGWSPLYPHRQPAVAGSRARRDESPRLAPGRELDVRSVTLSLAIHTAATAKHRYGRSTTS